MLLYASAFSLFSQEKFDHLTIKDGLSNNSISSIIQSKDGFLWFGTLNGLNRYDGKEIKSYTYEPGNKYSLSSNRINYLYEDSLSYIWILTYEFQVLRFDPQTERFININLEIPHGKFRGRSPVKIFNSSPSIVWIISEDGDIIRVKQQKGYGDLSFDCFSSGENTIIAKSTFIYKASDNRIWIGTHKGLMVFDNDSADYSLLTRDNKYIVDTSNYFICCYELDKDHLVFGTSGRGLFEYENNEMRQCSFLPDSCLIIKDIEGGENDDFVVSTRGNGFYHINQDLKVTNYQMSDIKDYFETYCDRTGTFWLLTSKRGISMFNPRKAELCHFDLHSENRESLGDPDKQKLFEDDKGSVWIGIYGGGLCKFNREDRAFEYFHHQKNSSHSLSSNNILTLYEDQSDNLWIGTFKNGLNKMDLSDKALKNKELVKNPVYESQNEVRCIVEDAKNRVWLGTKYGDIFCCDKENNILFRIPEDLKENSNYIRSNIYALLIDGNDLWVGTKGKGLYHIKDVIGFENSADNLFKTDVYQHTYEDLNGIPGNDIFSLLKDQYGQIWIGTYHGGLSVIKNPDSEIIFTNYHSNPADSTSICDNRIRKIYQDRNDNLWIGTVNGLNYLDARMLLAERKKFQWFYKDPTNANSLTNNDIFDIHQDLNGTIWVATYGGGLNSISLRNNEPIFDHFFRKDGLSSDIVFSILEDSDQNLWLGTDNGLGKFSVKDHTFELIEEEDGLGHGVFSEGCKFRSDNGEFLFGTLNGYLRFSPGSVNNKRKSYPLRLTGLKLFNELILPEADGSPLTRSIDNTTSVKLKYNQNFIEINFAVMDFKAPDKIQYAYILENFEEKWNKTVNGSNAFYKGIPPGEYIFKVKATDSKGVWMDEVRELVIIITPPFWKTIWAYILYFFLIAVILFCVIKELRTRNEISYENKLLEEKFKFFTNVSHEFKTPLTLINNSIEDISNANTFSDDVIFSIGLIQKNVQSMNALIEQIIDLRRLQKGKLELQTREIDIVSYVYDIYLTFLPYAEKKKLKFKFLSSEEFFFGWLDTRYVDKIINNLLSNAFKHTSQYKNVVLELDFNNKLDSIRIKVRDEGDGIDMENQEKIFDRFVFVKNGPAYNFKGSGIGLSLVSELVQLHKGIISLESTFGVGSIFTVELPAGRNHYSENERICDGVVSSMPKPYSLTMDPIKDDQFEKVVPQHIKSANAVRVKVLVIDDNDELRNYLLVKLKKQFTMFVAENGELGVKLAKEVKPDLIVTDLIMPKIDGLGLIKYLKSNFETSHIPIILLTATASVESIIDAFESGADDYITKPFNLELLKTRIINIVQQRKQLKEKFSKDPGFSPAKISSKESDQKFLSDVIKSIENSINKPDYNIETMINELGCSRTVFFKKMKTVSGYAPKEFVRVVKMKKAAELLRNASTTVAEVGFEIGFTDPSYFTKSFKNFFGETPTSYQKKYS